MNRNRNTVKVRKGDNATNWQITTVLSEIEELARALINDFPIEMHFGYLLDLGHLKELHPVFDCPQSALDRISWPLGLIHAVGHILFRV
jgi:hypothetical protein